MPPKPVAPPYPEKLTYKKKGLNINVPAHTATLGHAYKTTRDVAREIKEAILPFVQKAKERIDHLIYIIQILRKEINEAREALAVANADHLHVSLMAMDEDPSLWRKDEEYIQAP